MKSKIAGVMLFGVLIFSVPSAFAAQTPDTLFTKLGRGLANIATCPLEIIIQPIRIASIDQKPAVAWTGGLFQGVYFTLARAVTGVYDVVTFPFPLPRKYRPIFWPATTQDAFMELAAKRWPYPKFGFDL